MSEIFKLLTGGAQFNRKRFRNDFEVFQCNKTNNNGHGGSTKSGAPITANDKLSLLTTTAAAVHSELDFFNMNDTPVNSSSSSSSGSSSSTFNKAEDNASLKKARREDFDSSSATSIVNSTSDNPTDPKPIRLKSIEQVIC